METEVNQLLESIKFMILGMGVVYVFLLILIQAIELQKKIILKYFPDKDADENITIHQDKTLQSIEKEESAKIAAIVAAVAEFRKEK